MLVSPIASMGIRAAVRPVAAIAPVSRAKSAKRASTAKSAQRIHEREPGSGAPTISAASSPAPGSSSAVQAALNDLRIGG